MTIIEFFDKNAIENMLGALCCQPDRIIFVGHNRKQMEKHLVNYRDVIQRRGVNVELLPPRVMNRNNLPQIVASLSKIVEEFGDCDFNLDGGEELYLVAVGMVAQKYPGKVRLHRFNIRNNSITDCDADGEDHLMAPIVLDIRENISIYGGEVVDVTQHSDGTYPWNFTETFRRDVEKLWKICCDQRAHWNGCINTLAWAIKVMPQEDPRVFLCRRSVVEPEMEREHDRYRMKLSVLKALEEEKLISWLRAEGDEVEFVFKSEQVKMALSKAGQVLELMATMAAMDALEADGTPVYNDVRCGVYIDWDGDVEPEGDVDVSNEVDVMMMKGAVPVFVSCKNGNMDPNELYKLETVAQRFGGKYARKVLIAPMVDELGEKGDYIRARAADMDIRVVYNFDHMTYEEMKREMKCLWLNSK